jgi:hypothetical protein
VRRDLFGRQARDVHAENLDRARSRQQETDRYAHAGRLASAVAPEESEEASFAERK